MHRQSSQTPLVRKISPSNGDSPEGETSPTSDATKPRTALRVGLCAAMAVLFTTIILHYSFRHGRLSIHPTFDDIGYMASSMQRLEVLYGDPQHSFRPIRDFLANYYHRPPHSPYSELLGMSAFAIFGPHDWAPYAANALLAFCFFFFADWILPGIKLWQRITCLIFLATVPLMGMAVHEFRPDHAVSLATAAGILLAITQPFIFASRRRLLAIGTLFGLAMLIKPPVFPATIIYFWATVLAATACDWFIASPRPHFAQIMRAWGTTVVPFVLIPLPHYYINGSNIVVYIHEILFGLYKDSFQLHADRSVHLKYFFTGFGGRVMLGVHLGLLFGILGVGLGAMLIQSRSRQRIVRAAAMFALLLLTVAIPIKNPTKSEFFALTFDILLALLAIYTLGQMMAFEQRRRFLVPAASILLLGVTFCGLMWFRWPTRVGDFNEDWVRNRTDIGNGIYNTIFEHAVEPMNQVAPYEAVLPSGNRVVASQPRIMLTAIGDISSALFAYMAAVDNRRAGFFESPDTLNLKDYRDAADKADFIIAGEQGSGLIADFLPGYPVKDQVIAELRQRRDFREIARFPFIRTGKGFVVFQRLSFCGWVPISGVGPLEGPPKIKDQYTRALFWGYGPATKMKVTAPEDGNYEIYWEVHNGFAGETISIKLDGAAVKDVLLSGDPGFIPTTIPLKLNAGEHVLELDYSQWNHEGDRPMSVLFQAFRIEPAR